MDEPEFLDDSPDGSLDVLTTYPIPDATIAAHPAGLAAVAAAILGVLVFLRRKKPTVQSAGPGSPGTTKPDS
jgi:hypothetical protein